jgi:Flp pilus assembly protein TadG
MMKRSRQQGVAAIEFAILLVPLSVILFGTIELGRAFYQYDTLAKSVRAAARYLSVQTPGTGIDQAKCMTVSGTTACGSPLLANLDTSMVTINYIDGVSTCTSGSTGGCGAINLVEVCVNCSGSAQKFKFVSMATLFVPDITFRQVRAVMRREGA